MSRMGFLLGSPPLLGRACFGAVSISSWVQQSRPLLPSSRWHQGVSVDDSVCRDGAPLVSGAALVGSAALGLH